MSYDEDLADRVRELVGAEPGLTEQKMFGGLAFLISGNMAVAASGQGGIMVRAEPGAAAELVEMRGRPMQGWLRVTPEQLQTRPELARWVELGVAYARSLPPKRR